MQEAESPSLDSNELMMYVFLLQLYDSFPMIRGLPLPFTKAFKNVVVCQLGLEIHRKYL